MGVGGSDELQTLIIIQHLLSLLLCFFSSLGSLSRGLGLGGGLCFGLGFCLRLGLLLGGLALGGGDGGLHSYRYYDGKRPDLEEQVEREMTGSADNGKEVQ